MTNDKSYNLAQESPTYAINPVSESQQDSLYVTLTPSSDLVWGGVADYQILSGRAGDDTLYGFDRSLNKSTKTQLNIDILSGDVEPVPGFFFQDLLNILGGNPPSGGRDKFVLGDWRKSYYNQFGSNDFAFIFDFNPKQDTIQLHGSAADYDFISVPFLGTAMFEKSKTSPFFWDGDMVGIVFWNFDLNSQSSNIKYVGYTPPPEPVQPKIEQFGTVGVDIAFDTAVDTSGNVYVTGITNGYFQGSNAGSYDNWIAKYNNGKLLWLKQFGSSNSDLSAAIATDKWGNIYVAGGTQGNLGGSKQASEQDAWLAKYDSNGNQLWVRQFGSFYVSGTTDIDVDENGDVYLSGLTLKPDPRPDDNPNKIIDRQDDVWVAKYDTDGKQKWFTEVASPKSSVALWDEAYGVKVAPDGSVYATGWTYGNFNNSDQFNYYDAWIAKFNKDGQREWIQQFGTPSFEFSWDVDIDSKGNIYLYGWTKGNLGGENAGADDLWLAKYHSDGTQEWIQQFGTSGIDTAFVGGLKIDSNDNIFLAGYTNGNLGGANAGAFDTFVARYDTNGNRVWIQQFGTPELDGSTNLAVDNTGHLYVSGFTEGSLGSLNNGAVDAWIAKLDTTSGDIETFNPSASTELQEIMNTSNKNDLNAPIDNNKVTTLVSNATSPNSSVNSSNNSDPIGKAYEAISSLYNILFQTLLSSSNDTLATPQYDALITTLTPASDLAFAGFGDYQLVFGRSGNDTLYPFDTDLNPSEKTPVHIDMFFGDSEVIKILLFQDFLNILGGNPPSSGADTFVLGDWKTSYYNKSAYNDFGFIFDFNSKQDTIQLRGSAKDYQLVDVPFLGTAIFEKKPGSSSVFEDDLVGIVFANYNLDLNNSYFKYTGTTPPLSLIQPQIKQLGTAGLDLGADITVDSLGNVYVVGLTNGSLEGSNVGSYDSWITKYDSNGKELWGEQIGTSKNDIAVALTTDKWGNLYVVGGTQGDLGDKLGSQTQDAWIAKYDSNGKQLWIQQLGSEYLTGATNIVTDDSGAVYVSGLTVLPDPRPDSNPSKVIALQDDFWVTKYDTNGKKQWFTQVGSPINSIALFDEAYGITLGKDGAVYTTGWTYGDFSGQEGGSFENFRYYDAFIAKLNSSSGQLEKLSPNPEQDVVQFGSPTFDFSWGIVSDSQNNLYTTGWTRGDLGGENAGQEDVWVAKTRPDGSQEWIRQFGTSGADGLYLGGVAIDANDHIFLAGYTDGNLGGINAGLFDVWVASYDTKGNQLWIKQFGTPETDFATKLAVDVKTGSLYVTGFTGGSLGEVNAGAMDAWIAKFDSSTGAMLGFNPSNQVEPTAINPITANNNIGGQTGAEENAQKSFQINVNSDNQLTDSKNILTSRANNLLFVSGSGSQVDLQFEIEQNNASLVNEVGAFVTDNEKGEINGILPGQAGYLEAAMKRSQILFSVLPYNQKLYSTSDTSLDLLGNRKLSFNSGSYLNFYLVQNGSTQEVLNNLATGTSIPSIFFGTSLGTNNFDHLKINTLTNSSFSLAWKETNDTDSVFDDLVIKVSPSTTQTTFGTKLKSQNELIDLRDTQDSISTQFIVHSEAMYKNYVGLYTIDDVTGRIGNLLPKDSGYAQAAIKRSIANFDKNTTNAIQQLNGGTLLAPYIIVNGSTEQFMNLNSSNQFGQGPQAYFAFTEANPDKVDHIRLLGDNQFGFEDIYGGGDRDYNDMILQVNTSSGSNLGSSMRTMPVISQPFATPDLELPLLYQPNSSVIG